MGVVTSGGEPAALLDQMLDPQAPVVGAQQRGKMEQLVESAMERVEKILAAAEATAKVMADSAAQTGGPKEAGKAVTTDKVKQET